MDFKILRQSPLSSWDSANTTKGTKTFDFKKRSNSEDKAYRTSIDELKSKKNSSIFPSSDPYANGLTTEFSSSMNDFLRNSAEIKGEFHKLADSCKLSTPRKSAPNLGINLQSENPFESPRTCQKSESKITHINSLLSKIGSPQIDGGYDSIAEKLINVLCGHQKIPRHLQTSQSLRSLSLSNKNDDGIIPTPRSTMRMWEQAKLSKEEQIFGSFLGRKFDSNSQHDVMILGIIFMYEEQKRLLQGELRRFQSEPDKKESAKCETNEPRIKRLENQIKELKEENLRLKHDLSHYKNQTKSSGTTRNHNKDAETLQNLCCILETGVDGLVEETSKLKSLIVEAHEIERIILKFTKES